MSYSREHPIELTGDKGSTFRAIHQIRGVETTEFTLRAHGNKLKTSKEKDAEMTMTSKYHTGKKRPPEESKNIFE